MKKLLLLVFSVLLISETLFSQQTYYDNVNLNLTGLALRDELGTKLTSTHTNTLSYTEARECLKIIDLEPGQNNNVFLIYGFSNNTCPSSTSDDNDHRLRDKSSFGGGTSCEWNREHVYAQSQGTPALGQSGPGADAHHLRASDVQRNGQRGNLHFVNGSGNSGSTNGGWYPGDEWRGDVARILMYMYIRYGSQCLPNGITIGNSNSIDSDMVNVLLDWNASDPVSAYEDVRNTYLENTANTYGQGNRNPFIDEPYLATLIWGGTPAEDRWGIYGSGDTEAPSIPANLITSNPTSSTVDLTWTTSTDNVAVTSYDIYVDGSYDSSSANNSYTVTGLSSSTTFSFTVLAKDAANNMSAQSTSVNGTTLAGGSGGGNDLIFSEYMEGSSNNKAIEVANITGSPVDLSVYSVKLSANGAAGWTTATYNFPSILLASNDVFVIANSNLAICTGVIDATSSVANFNGNDAIGLFKNNILIDILGTLGNNATYASNTTLIRNLNIIAPNTIYTPSEWTVYSSNTCSDLGTHSYVLGTQLYTISDIKIFPNPTSGNSLTIHTQEDVSISVFDILGKQVLRSQVSRTNNQLDISCLNSGMYLIRLETENGSATKKFIKK